MRSRLLVRVSGRSEKGSGHKTQGTRHKLQGVTPYFFAILGLYTGFFLVGVLDFFFVLVVVFFVVDFAVEFVVGFLDSALRDDFDVTESFTIPETFTDDSFATGKTSVEDNSLAEDLESPSTG